MLWGFLCHWPISSIAYSKQAKKQTTKQKKANRQKETLPNATCCAYLTTVLLRLRRLPLHQFLPLSDLRRAFMRLAF